jgi:amidohydrolase
MSTYLDRAEELTEKITAIRRDLHMHPETSFQEVRTAKKVTETLDLIGIKYKTGIAKTGVVAELGSGKPVIALRADMDALPIEETNDVPYKSVVKGKMHACGHDAHTACLLGAAIMLKDDFAKGKLKGTVRFIFQPSEENWDSEGKSGGRRMVEEGALDGVDAVVGQHVISSYASNEVFLREGPVMAAVDTFEGSVVGRGGHGAYPHQALDPIWLSAQVVNAIHGIVSRRVSPVESGVITVTQIHAGTADNIIPAEVILRGTIRSFKPEVRKILHENLEKAFSIARSMGGDYKFKIQTGYPATVNNPEMTRFVREMATDLLGKERVHETNQHMGAEDFSFMAQAKPGVFFYLGAKKDDVDRQHHASDFDIDERVLPTGAALMAEAARKFLTEGVKR